MKERPILFSAEMVKAILDGHKTMTRRVIKPQPEYVWGYGVRRDDQSNFSAHVRFPRGNGPDPWIRCPYGKRDDRLWVRETWTEIVHGERALYRADLDKYQEAVEWSPSIFMPRWASRITLEITGVRVERVQDISDADAMAEGISDEQASEYWCDGPQPVGAFSDLWDTINAKRGYGWDVNPWVWVIEFKKVN